VFHSFYIIWCYFMANLKVYHSINILSCYFYLCVLIANLYGLFICLQVRSLLGTIDESHVVVTLNSLLTTVHIISTDYVLLGTSKMTILIPVWFCIRFCIHYSSLVLNVLHYSLMVLSYCNLLHYSSLVLSYCKVLHYSSLLLLVSWA